MTYNNSYSNIYNTTVQEKYNSNLLTNNCYDTESNHLLYEKTLENNVELDSKQIITSLLEYENLYNYYMYEQDYNCSLSGSTSNNKSEMYNDILCTKLRSLKSVLIQQNALLFTTTCFTGVFFIIILLLSCYIYYSKKTSSKLIDIQHNKIIEREIRLDQYHEREENLNFLVKVLHSKIAKDKYSKYLRNT